MHFLKVIFYNCLAREKGAFIMASRRTLGYIQNEWTCPNCGTRNKGGVKTCENCGAPQPENVQFELPSEQKFVTDEAAIKAAKAGRRYPLSILRHTQPGLCKNVFAMRRRSDRWQSA